MDYLIATWHLASFSVTYLNTVQQLCGIEKYKPASPKISPRQPPLHSNISWIANTPIPNPDDRGGFFGWSGCCPMNSITQRWYVRRQFRVINDVRTQGQA